MTFAEKWLKSTKHISLGPVLNMGPKRRGLTKGSPAKSEPGAKSAKSKVSCLFEPLLFAVLSPKL